MVSQIMIHSLRCFLKATAATVLAGFIVVPVLADQTEKPNVILIMTDDQGYGDVSAHGSPVLKTPEIDKLHASSVRFADFHVAPMCTPTRGQLMTGIDAMRNGATAVCRGRSMVRREFKMMPQYFAEAGYATGLFGKWHLGDSYPHRPRFRGFQEVLSFRAWGLTSLADHWDNHTDPYLDPVLMHNGVDKKYSGYCTDIFFAEAMKWMEQCADQKKPFFLYLPTNTPHVPDIVPGKYSRPYVGKYKGKPIPHVFYGMIANIDENIGKLEALLKERGLRDNTILIFLSDNGTQSRDASNLYSAGMRDKKTSVFEGGHRVPLFVRWLDGNLQHGSDIAELTTVQDLLPTLMELCGLEGDPSVLDGTSLASLLEGTRQTLPDRMVVNQYKSSCQKWNSAVVMQGKWRLIGGNELYNIADDPHQDRNVYEQFPEIARGMNAHYDQWFAEARPEFEKPRHIIIGSREANPVILYASDWQGGYCDNTTNLKKADTVGYWDLMVDRAGTYELELRRWPKESGKTFTEGFEGPANKDSTARPIVVANVQVADGNYTLDVADGSTHATFNIKLPKGKVKLRTALLDARERTLCSAMYVDVKRLEDSASATLTPVSGREPQGRVAAAPKTKKTRPRNE
jgi:arylsulfatase